MSSTRYFISTKSSGENEYAEELKAIDRSSKAQPYRNFSKRKSVSDPFPGPAPISEGRVNDHKRGDANNNEAQDWKIKKLVNQQEKKYQSAAEQAARHDLFLLEDPGFIETAEGQKSYTISQSEIKQHVDIATACKQFELNLDQFGPYRIDYTKIGKQLLIGGKLGHVAAFEWFSKRLLCEINVMEIVNDVKWLHTESMFAVAQKRWTYIYDNQGVELHCLKGLHQTLRLDYLPYHFLLVASTAKGFLHYLDVSVGKIITSIPTKSNRLNVLTQNPYNAVMVAGHHNGTVTMWSPNMKEPLVKMLCHKNAIRAVAVDKSGYYMATSGQDSRMKIFDIRTFKPVHSYKVMYSPSNIKFSQRGLLAATCKNIVEIYKDPCREIQEEPYLIHKLKHPAEDIAFCPYEDVLGIGREDGFESILVPGSGEPNYDSMESNPFRSKSQRREWEVKALLEKIQPDMITLDPYQIGTVDKVTADRLQKDKDERTGFKKQEQKFEPKYKAKGRSSAGNIEKRKEVVRNHEIREKIKRDQEAKRRALDMDYMDDKGTKSALRRFKRKK